MTTEDFDESSDAAGEPGLLVCAMCGHPNLDFRSHCRRCRESLHGGNLIPGASLIEWSPTDAPGGESCGRPRTRSLAMLFLLVVFGLSLVMLATHAGAMAAAVAGVVGFLVLMSVLRSQHAASDAEAEVEGAHDDSARRCPECSGTVAAIDDICPACGAIIAEDWPPAQRR